LYDIYAELLKLLPGRLGEIPWARTGTSYGSRGQPSDDYGTEHHRYGEWMRNDLRKEMARMVQSEEIYGLNLFNEFALDQLMSIWPKSNTITTNAVDELVSWIASLSAFIRKYSVAGLDKYERTPCQSLAERSRSVIGAQKARAYISLRDRFRQ
jgi:asparagine synthase (glutamine-hydrolysing)